MSISLQFNKKETLALAWMGNELECGLSKRGSESSSFKRYQNVSSVGDVGNCLSQFLAETSYKGRSVSLLLDGCILESNTLTLPPGSKRVQDVYIKEKASRIQSQDGAIIWEAQKIAVAKSGQKVIFNSIAQSKLNELKKVLSKHGLFLNALYPFSAVVPKFSHSVAEESQFPGLIVAQTGQSLKLISLNEKGSLEFARDLSLDSSVGGQRISVELNRCVLFARQQFGSAIRNVILIGEKAQALEESVRNTLSDDISIFSLSAGDDIWLQQAIETHCHNLAQEDMAKERKRTWNRAAALAACAALGFFALTYAWEKEQAWTTLQSDIAALKSSQDAMREGIGKLNEKRAKANRLQSLIEQSSKDARPPVETALLSWLSQNLNDELWITELETTWDASQSKWIVRLVAQSEGSRNRASELADRLKLELESSPLEMSISSANNGGARKAQVKGTLQQIHTIVVEGEIHHG